jgi:hypothetical protein
VERFNGTMRDELLNGEEFDNLLEARVLVDAWNVEYNTVRPHRGPGDAHPRGVRPTLEGGRSMRETSLMRAGPVEKVLTRQAEP